MIWVCDCLTNRKWPERIWKNLWETLKKDQNVPKTLEFQLLQLQHWPPCQSQAIISSDIPQSTMIYVNRMIIKIWYRR